MHFCQKQRYQLIKHYSPPTAAQKPFSVHSEQQPEPEPEPKQEWEPGLYEKFLRPLPLDKIPYKHPAMPASACSCLQLRDQDGKAGEMSSEVEGGPGLGGPYGKSPQAPKGSTNYVCKKSKVAKKNSTMSVK